MVKEYKCWEVDEYIEDTEEKLNRLAKEGWKLVCSYSKNNYYLIMERELNVCKKCGR